MNRRVGRANLWSASRPHLFTKREIKMRPNEIVREINKLELSEKLLLVEDIWDSIAQKNNFLSMPTWQKVELEKRYKQYQDGALELYDWKTVHAQLRENHK